MPKPFTVIVNQSTSLFTLARRMHGEPTINFTINGTCKALVYRETGDPAQVGTFNVEKLAKII